MSQGRNIAIGAVAFVVATLAIVSLLYQSTEPGDVELDIDPAPEVGKIAPAPAPASKPRTRVDPRPRDTPVPASLARPNPTTENVPPDVKQDYNYAMRDAVKEARIQCIAPYVDEVGMLEPATMVMDAVVTDGELTDISLRSVGDMPKDVVDCARDAAWAIDWPSWDGQGELRFQETFTVSNRSGSR